ncbi:LysR family transcriptional regulator [Arthrobacter antibioticus]|uniref:LysR family transcriptional regulator n=1 Tax=Arthrobacter sp. H35-MC1 TaxID=3046203 RepID=UPI0024BBC71F|nr:LysR family transcriptional regulator [Arthrobacter sp. H35-MC1]MDJ0315579.1 LysR family transcriptional regulator [Arthrobacter sp. H35-MC1]
MLNIVHIRTLTEVVRLGSFTAAGNRLGYTASAVSQQMASLERETGIQLFVRSARSIQPTPAAQAMSLHGVKLMREAELLIAAGNSAGGSHEATLRVGAFPSAATFIVPMLLDSQVWQSRGVGLLVTIGEPSATVPGLRAGGELDVCLVYQLGESGLVLPQGVTKTWLGEDPFQIIVPARWRMDSAAVVGANDVAGMPWILHLRGSSDSSVIDSVLANAGIHPRVVAFSDDFQATLRLVAAGHGIAMVPSLAMLERPAGITVIQVPQIALSRQLIGLSAEDAPADLVAAFWEAVGQKYQPKNA